MQYAVHFANSRIGAGVADPLTVVVSDWLGASEKNAELSRHIRDHAVRVLTASPATGAITANSSEIERNVNVLVDTHTGEGSVYFGTSTVAALHVRAIN